MPIGLPATDWLVAFRSQQASLVAFSLTLTREESKGSPTGLP